MSDYQTMIPAHMLACVNMYTTGVSFIAYKTGQHNDNTHRCYGLLNEVNDEYAYENIVSISFVNTDAVYERDRGRWRTGS
jgi:hypothetical protein